MPEMTSPSCRRQRPAVFGPSLLLVQRTHACTCAAGGLRGTPNEGGHRDPDPPRNRDIIPMIVRKKPNLNSFYRHIRSVPEGLVESSDPTDSFCSFFENAKGCHAAGPPNTDWKPGLVLGVGDHLK